MTATGSAAWTMPRMTRWIGAALVIVAVGGGITWQAARSASAATGVPPAVTRLADTRLDPSALYFVSYDGLVNNASFQRSAILTASGYQYAAWYTADRSAVLGRRRLPDGAWQTVTLPHRLSTNDSHNVISLGISPNDGRLHVAMDVHDSAIFYLRSEAGLIPNAGSRSWELRRFGPVQRTLDGIDLGGITYPQFITTPEHALQLSFRTGHSGNGTNELAEFDSTGWHRLGAWSGSTGSYSANGATSTTRSMYLHGLDYTGTGRLYASFTWREGNGAVTCNPGGLTNHDTGVVHSDDRGRTWLNDANRYVGSTGGAPVSVGSPGLVVDPLNPDHGLMNQESQAVDPAGNLHVIISYVPGRFGQCVTNYAADRTANGRAFHLYRDASGWHKVEIGVPLNSVGRSRLVFDSYGNAYVVMPYGRVVAASRSANWADWKVLFDGTSLNAFGEVTVDYERVASQGVLSIMYQQKSTGTTPSPIRVLDLRLG